MMAEKWDLWTTSRPGHHHGFFPQTPFFMHHQKGLRFFPLQLMRSHTLK
jgi:hypothetical protein